jgi:hypothetical protein
LEESKKTNTELEKKNTDLISAVNSAVKSEKAHQAERVRRFLIVNILNSRSAKLEEKSVQGYARK